MKRFFSLMGPVRDFGEGSPTGPYKNHRFMAAGQG